MSGWTVEFLDKLVEEEFERLPSDMQASIGRIISLIESHGLPRVIMPYVRHLRGKIWEMRGKARDGIARSVYITVTGKRVVILRSFVKKTRQTPSQEIEIAVRRAREAGYEP
jgi:phage-related protein